MGGGRRPRRARPAPGTEQTRPPERPLSVHSQEKTVEVPMMNRITEQATAESRMMRRTSFQVSVL